MRNYKLLLSLVLSILFFLLLNKHILFIITFSREFIFNHFYKSILFDLAPLATLFIGFIPFWSYLSFKKVKQQSIINLLKMNIISYFFFSLIFLIGIALSIIINAKPTIDSALLPDFIVFEPFFAYWTLVFMLGSFFSLIVFSVWKKLKGNLI